MPLADTPQILLFHVSYAPLLAPVVVRVAVLNYSSEQVRLNFRRAPDSAKSSIREVLGDGK